MLSCDMRCWYFDRWTLLHHLHRWNLQREECCVLQPMSCQHVLGFWSKQLHFVSLWAHMRRRINFVVPMHTTVLGWKLHQERPVHPMLCWDVQLFSQLRVVQPMPSQYVLWSWSRQLHRVSDWAHLRCRID